MKYLSLKYLPNACSLCRGFLLPLVFWLLVTESYGLSAVLIIFLSLTDWADGYVARYWSVTSATGALLDAIMDKIFATAAALALALFTGLPIFYAVLVVVRSVSQMLAVPILSWWLKIPFNVRPKILPKWATAATFFIFCTHIILFWLKAVGYIEINLFNFLSDALWWLMGCSALAEGYILCTYYIRLVQIIRRQHDTFE